MGPVGIRGSWGALGFSRDLRPALQPCWEQRPRAGRGGGRLRKQRPRILPFISPLAAFCFAFCPQLPLKIRVEADGARSSVKHKEKPRQGAPASLLASRSTPDRGASVCGVGVDGGRATVLLSKVAEILGGQRGNRAEEQRKGREGPSQIKSALVPDVGQAWKSPQGLLGQ